MEPDGPTRRKSHPPQERRELLRRLTARPGLCESCEHLRLLASARSVFVFCGRSEFDPRFPRYPPLPVVSCPGYLEAATEDPADRILP